MKKNSTKIKLSISIISVIIIYIIYINCFNLISNYAEKGYPGKHSAVAGPYGAYLKNLYLSLNTIIENDEYGILVVRKSGKFIYFPHKNFIEPEKENVYKYEGYWYLSDKMKFTITRTTLNKSGFNLSFKDFEYSCKIYIDYNHEYFENNWFSDNLFINDIEFHPLENITENEKERLFLDDEIIDKFLKGK
ncbi:hypothetical protein [Sedimentibacter sp.]|uniref:hypothetical protein n=1 Tax=Sedimentibacter sp. TaxID=1960295 RepID=UPI0028A728EA|nr:hypothetical protein [Sedimentibacter sp.]